MRWRQIRVLTCQFANVEADGDQEREQHSGGDAMASFTFALTHYHVSKRALSLLRHEVETFQASCLLEARRGKVA